MKAWTPEEIKEFRLSQGYYQKDLALLLGVTVQYVCYLEKGVRKPSKTLKALLDCLERQATEKRKEVRKRGKGQR